MTEFKIESLVGSTINEITGLKEGSENVEFTLSDGRSIVMYHLQDCCEGVSVEEIVGNVEDLIGSKLVLAEEVISRNENPVGVTPPEYIDESFTWTFYKLATVKGSVTIRWYGSSNGYYSESVSLIERQSQNVVDEV